MKKTLFWILFAVYISVLAAMVVKTVNYVKAELQYYEASQPEKVVEAELDKLAAAATNDATESIITFHDIEQAEYDIDISDFREYKDKLKSAGQFTYKIKNSYSETEQQYYIMAGEEAVAVLTLESVKEEVKLAILTVNEWKVKSVTPILTLANYDYVVEVPTGFRVTINGTGLTNVQEENNGWETYVVETLYSEPEIKIYDAYGNEALYDIVDNHVRPIVYSYSLTLPTSFSVFAGGVLQEGATEGGEVCYDIVTLQESLELEDAYGNRTEYKGGDSIYTYDYVVKIPDNFRITVGGNPADCYVTAEEEIVKFQYAAEYAKMPKILTYTITKALREPEIVIYDNLNQKVECVFENYSFEVTEQTGRDSVPEEIAAEIDVLEIGRKWSKFMTGDLEGSKKGFGTMKKYLIEDSYLYNVAYKWINSADSTYTPRHTFKNPPFTEEKVSNFVSYGDTMFSCDIYFIKHMYLTSYKMDVDDVMNSTFYFMNYDDTEDGKDNPHWVIIDIQENLSE